MPLLYYKGTIREVTPADRKALCNKFQLSEFCTNLELQSKKLNLQSFTIAHIDPLDFDLGSIPENIARAHSTEYPKFWTQGVLLKYNALTGSDLPVPGRQNQFDLSQPTPSIAVPPVQVTPVVQPTVGQINPVVSPILPAAPPLPLPQQSPSRTLNMDVSQLVAQAMGSISLIDVNIFEYQGFDPNKIRQMVLALGSAVPEKVVQVGNRNINLGGRSIGNDLAFMVTLGLMRGNGIKKIEQKSLPGLNIMLKIVQGTYKLVEKTDGSATAITLMRIVNSFPEVAFAALSNGRGRNIASLQCSLVLANSVSFQMVKRENFKNYAMHFLYVNHRVDLIINKAPKKITPLKELWNYMILAFNSTVIPNESRMSNIGEPLAVNREHFSYTDKRLFDTIEQLISAGNAAVIA